MDDSIGEIKHGQNTRIIMDGLGIDVQSAVLHEDMNRAEDVAEYLKTPWLICNKTDVIALARMKSDASVEIVAYRETVSLASIIVHDMNHNVLP